MDPNFWIERWKNAEIGFHREKVHDFLPRYWASLGLAAGSAVFVPLCGKSYDMVWLAAQGHRVIGCELSPLAVDAFFREQDLVADVRPEGALAVWSAGPFTIWCGDIFELPQEALRDVAAVYDRAALVAFPPSLQVRYAETLLTLLPPEAPMLLVSLAYPDGQINGPPFSTPLAQVDALFADTHDIALAETRDGLDESQNLKARGVTSLDETAYILKRT
ncbi:thiopurine S-methyltransferase [Hyphomicrobium nitrativorans NL23]|uniref:Thiopurine S-methyltransferase n=1 Tax=Hyphomicrobium nitrativorans NL23 TaxID=1029756 RepID=V5SBP3_9HYPH|nr:thiopurine S-methyltransferase [Hyphomicrobium nitrativorans]AHB47953.1 thiopurine S-methyltransferase [Hyphomicrobium nitrativorans NL23]